MRRAGWDSLFTDNQSFLTIFIILPNSYKTHKDMKKSFFILAISSLFLISCADKKPKLEKNTTNTPKIENSDIEVNKIDSITNQLEKAKDEIEDAAKEVDKLLDEL